MIEKFKAKIEKLEAEKQKILTNFKEYETPIIVDSIVQAGENLKIIEKKIKRYNKKIQHYILEDCVKIEQKDKYNECSKYYDMSLSELKTIFEQRCLNWNYYLDKAKKEEFTCWIGHVSVISILTSELQWYDQCIREYYNECINKGFKTSDIFKSWKDIEMNSHYIAFKFI